MEDAEVLDDIYDVVRKALLAYAAERRLNIQTDDGRHRIVVVERERRGGEEYKVVVTITNDGSWYGF